MHLRASLAVLLAAALAVSPAVAANTHHPTKSSSAVHHSTVHSSRSRSSHHASTRRVKSRRSRRHVLRGQQAIQPERVMQIQQALIQADYLKGEANGEWDDATVAAMKKYQADHGWQTKLTPDSRALKGLGLGPDYSNALNANDASFTPPPPVTTIPSDEAAGFAAAAKVNQ